MEIFKLEKPDIEKKAASAFEKLLRNAVEITRSVEAANNPKYLYWDKVRYRPCPKEMTVEEFWAIVKTMRQLSPNRSQTAIRDEDGNNFSWQSLPRLDYFLHEVDMQLGGALQSGLVDDLATRRKYITRGIMEEAIASSQLEGANTTRREAKRMLLEGRKPRTNSEQMILNNYQAMLMVEEGLKNEPLSTNLLFDLHVALTENTIDSSEVGRFRTDKDKIVVSDPSTGIIYHIPPKASFLRKEIERFIKYANDDTTKDQFVHPLIKAIMLHFWIGYLHPFVDGNGRLARTVFYWYMLRKDYWAFSYLPLSKVIKKSPAQYRDAYVYSEQDDNDLTYFIDYILRKIILAKREFEIYAKRKQSENRKMSQLARSKFKLNDRQIQLLRYLYKNPEATTTITTHAHINEISRPTAQKDLEGLERLQFVTSRKVGTKRPFSAGRRLAGLFE